MTEILNSNQIEACDFLKIDCEGAEYEILQGTPKTFFKRIRRIAMEYHNNELHNFREIVSLLRDAEYTVRTEPS